MARQIPSSEQLSATNARLAVFRLLKRDHQQLKKNFQDFVRFRQSDEHDTCAKLAEDTCDLLEIYLTVKEEVLYPAIGAALPNPSQIEEAEVEHMTLKMLVAELWDIGNYKMSRYESVFVVLGDYVMNHLRNVETQMLAQLNHAALNWQQILDDLVQRRDELDDQIIMERQQLQSAPLNHVNGKQYPMNMVNHKNTTAH